MTFYRKRFCYFDFMHLLVPLRTYAYLVVLGAVAWEEVHVVEGLVGGQVGDLVEDQVVVLVEDREAGDEALDPLFLQAYQEASRMEEHLKTEALNYVLFITLERINIIIHT